MTTPVTHIIELPAYMRSAMRKQVNHGLMVAFINADLTSRAGLDVRSSIVLYDDAGVFEYAIPADMFDRVIGNPEVAHNLFHNSNVRFFTKGI